MEQLLQNIEGDDLGIMYIFINVTKIKSFESQLLLQEKMLKLISNEREYFNSEIENNSIVGQSEKIKNVIALIKKVADSDSNILVTGESGTGKELIARNCFFLTVKDPLNHLFR